MAEQNNATSWVLGGALLLIGLFVIIALVLVRAQAEVTQVTAANVLPSVANVKICHNGAITTGIVVEDCDTILGGNQTATLSSFSPISNSNRDMDIFAEVTDDNGTGDIQTVALTFYRSGALSSCSADNNDCYKVAACTLNVGTSGNTMLARCDIAVQHYVDPTSGSADDYSGENWKARVNVQDEVGGTFNEATTTEVDELVAVNFSPSTINYGSLSPGGTTSTNQTITGRNDGNVDTDDRIRADATTMACSVTGTIPSSNQKFDTTATSGTAYASLFRSLATSDKEINFASGTGVTASMASDTSSVLCRRTNDSSTVTDDSFFGITVPTGVEGTCTVAATVTAFKQSHTCSGN